MVLIEFRLCFHLLNDLLPIAGIARCAYVRICLLILPITCCLMYLRLPGNASTCIMPIILHFSLPNIWKNLSSPTHNFEDISPASKQHVCVSSTAIALLLNSAVA